MTVSPEDMIGGFESEHLTDFQKASAQNLTAYLSDKPDVRCGISLEPDLTVDDRDAESPIPHMLLVRLSIDTNKPLRVLIGSWPNGISLSFDEVPAAVVLRSSDAIVEECWHRVRDALDRWRSMTLICKVLRDREGRALEWHVLDDGKLVATGVSPRALLSGRWWRHRSDKAAYQ